MRTKPLRSLGWQRALDLFLGSQPAYDFKASGAGPVWGVTWTPVNGAAATTLSLGATGLRIVTDGTGTTYDPTADTAPRVWFDPALYMPGLNYRSIWRCFVRCYDTVSGPAPKSAFQAHVNGSLTIADNDESHGLWYRFGNISTTDRIRLARKPGNAAVNADGAVYHVWAMEKTGDEILCRRGDWANGWPVWESMGRVADHRILAHNDDVTMAPGGSSLFAGGHRVSLAANPTAGVVNDITFTHIRLDVLDGSEL